MLVSYLCGRIAMPFAMQQLIAAAVTLLLLLLQRCSVCSLLLKNYILNQIKSPYLEYDYIVKDNDTIESILKKFSVKQTDIALIVKQINKIN